MIRVNVNGSLLSDKKAVALQGITVDRKLFFELHLNEACKKSHSNIHTLGHPCYSFKTYFIEKTESYYESLYSVSIFLPPFSMDVPQQNFGQQNKLSERVLPFA